MLLAMEYLKYIVDKASLWENVLREGGEGGYHSPCSPTSPTTTFPLTLLGRMALLGSLWQRAQVLLPFM